MLILHMMILYLCQIDESLNKNIKYHIIINFKYAFESNINNMYVAQKLNEKIII